MKDDINDLFGQGFSLYKSDQYDEAIEYFDRMLAIDTNNLQALYGKSLVLNRLNLRNDALELFEYVIKHSGSTSDAMVGQYNYFIARVLEENPTMDLGKSFEKAIEIRAESTEKGIQMERQFIALVHGNYKFIRQALKQHESLGIFDVMTIETDLGEVIDYYFNIDDFFGKEFS